MSIMRSAKALAEWVKVGRLSKASAKEARAEAQAAARPEAAEAVKAVAKAEPVKEAPPPVITRRDGLKVWAEAARGARAADRAGKAVTTGRNAAKAALATGAEAIAEPWRRKAKEAERGAAAVT